MYIRHDYLFYMCAAFLTYWKVLQYVVTCLFHRFVIWASLMLEIRFQRHNQSFCLHLRLHCELSVSESSQLCLMDVKENPDIICGSAFKINLFTWSAEKCVCNSEMSTLSLQVPSWTSCQKTRAPFFSMRIQRLNKPNLLCLLSRVSVTLFTTTPSDIFSPANLPSSVFFSLHIMLLSLTQWQEIEREEQSECAWMMWRL